MNKCVGRKKTIHKLSYEEREIKIHLEFAETVLIADVCVVGIIRQVYSRLTIRQYCINTKNYTQTHRIF